MTAKNLSMRFHGVQLCREYVSRSYSNRQSTPCIGHCPVCCSFLINFVSVFHWTHGLSACTHSFFFCYVSFVSTLRYGSFFCSLSMEINTMKSSPLQQPYKATETQRTAEKIKKIFLLAIISWKPFKTSFLCPGLPSAKIRCFSHIPVFPIPSILQC